MPSIPSPNEPRQVRNPMLQVWEMIVHELVHRYILQQHQPEIFSQLPWIEYVDHAFHLHSVFTLPLLESNPYVSTGSAQAFTREALHTCDLAVQTVVTQLNPESHRRIETERIIADARRQAPPVVPITSDRESWQRYLEHQRSLRRALESTWSEVQDDLQRKALAIALVILNTVLEQLASLDVASGGAALLVLLAGGPAGFMAIAGNPPVDTHVAAAGALWDIAFRDEEGALQVLAAGAPSAADLPRLQESAARLASAHVASLILTADQLSANDPATRSGETSTFCAYARRRSATAA